jgi:beta-galactosidase/beta-glucuronidase
MKKSIIILIAAVVFCSVCFGHEWAPVGDKIMTQWGKEVTVDNAWDEYPRPQLVRKDWMNLNGLWNFALQGKTDLAPTSYSEKILVPFCVESSLSGVGKKVTEKDRVWYSREFEVPAGWAGKRVILNFEAVDWETAVWINDALIGTHKGAYDRFSYDITEYLKDSGKQRIVVSAWDPSSLGTQARGKQKFDPTSIWYTPVTGIWQTVWLEAVDKKAGIKEIKMVPDIDAGTIKIIAMGFEPTNHVYNVKATVLDGDKVVAEGVARIDKDMTIKIDSAKLWSPDSPFLYDLKLELFAGEVSKGELVEQVTSYFGMRKISLGDGEFGKVLMLNNKELFHYGTLDQGWWPDGLHTPPSDEAMKYDIEVTKQLGFNMIRKHIKVEPDRWFYWCDKLGILVWQDMPSAMAVLPNANGNGTRSPDYVGGDKPDIYRRTENAAQWEGEFRRMIDLHYNSPSVVIWVPFNEGWGQYDTCRIAKWVKSYDPTRLVNSVSGWALRPCGDVYDGHTYGVDLWEPKMQKDRATVLGEYGGIGYPVKGHLWNEEKRNWGYQTYHSGEELLKSYIHKFDQIVAMKKKGLSAAVYTQTTDVEGEVNGLMTYDREVIKFPADKMKEMHNKLYE